MKKRAPSPAIQFEFALQDKVQCQIAKGDVSPVLGFTADDFLTGRVDFRERLHSEDADFAARMFSLSGEMDSGSSLMRVRKADGTICCLHGTFSKSRSAHKLALALTLPAGSGWYAEEIESPELAAYRALMEDTQDAVVLKNRDHVVIAANRAVSEQAEPWLRGRSLIGLTAYDLLTEQEADRFHRQEKKILSGEPVSPELIRIEQPGEGAHWLYARYLPLKSEGDESVVGVLILTRTVTEELRAETELRKTAEHLQLFVEHAPAALAMFDREMRYVAVSRRWTNLYGLDAASILGRSHYEVIPDIPEPWREIHRRGLAGESLSSDEDRFDRSDGSVQWLRWEMLPWRSESGEVGGIILFVEDITVTKDSEERLKLAATVFEHASEAIMVTDLAGRILEVNESFVQITGYSREEILGKNPKILKSGIQSPAFYQEMWRSILETGRWRGELWNRTRNGDLYAWTSTITTVSDADGKPGYYVGLCTDVTPFKEQERRLEHIARYDTLTGLPNRSVFIERLRQAVERCAESQCTLAVAYFDLDAFKAVNDLHGAEAADRLLTSIAGRLRRNLREGDVLARTSGDEFAIMLLDPAEPESCGPMLDRMLHAISEPSAIGDDEVKVCASSGVTYFPQAQAVDAEQLLRQADQAMCAAKLLGGNRWQRFDHDAMHEVKGRIEERERIRQALNTGEMVLYYQPKVNMATGTLVGVEALIRWQHPVRGLLPPGLFLPQVEKDDLAIAIDEWVIEEALSQIEAWSGEGQLIPVSVNVSARYLQLSDFVERLRSILSAHPSVDPAWLELEVLETSALEDIGHVGQVIEACNGIGLSVAIDDFGTGYASLNYLKRLPATVLKIDRSFVRDMLEDSDDLAIFQGIMGLATAFRRIPIAEGVETVDHGVLLLKMGCYFAQGYVIARPMPADDLLLWHERWKPDPAWSHIHSVSSFDWPILLAEVELLSWDRSFEDFLKGERPIAPELDEHRCKFGAWLEIEGHGPRGSLPAIRLMEKLHAEAHKRARRAVRLMQLGDRDEALEEMNRTLELRHEVHLQLKQMFTRQNHEEELMGEDSAMP